MRLDLIDLSLATFFDRRCAKKADSFWSAPISDIMLEFLGFLGVCQEL